MSPIPGGVAAGQVIIHRHYVNASSLACVPCHGGARRERLAFARRISAMRLGSRRARRRALNIEHVLPQHARGDHRSDDIQRDQIPSRAKLAAVQFVVVQAGSSTLIALIRSIPDASRRDGPKMERNNWRMAPSFSSRLLGYVREREGGGVGAETAARGEAGQGWGDYSWESTAPIVSGGMRRLVLFGDVALCRRCDWVDADDTVGCAGCRDGRSWNGKGRGRREEGGHQRGL